MPHQEQVFQFKVMARFFGCGLCEAKFNKFEGLEKHMELKHEEELENEDTKEQIILPSEKIEHGKGHILNNG